MNPWAGLLGGPALVLLGVAAVRVPARFIHSSDAGFRIAYQLANKPYEGSRAHQFSVSVARLGGPVAIAAGSALFIAGIVLMVTE